MNEFLSKVPTWFFAAALFLFSVVLIITWFAPPDRSFRLFGSDSGFIREPVWTYTKTYENIEVGPIQMIPMTDGFCYLSAVTVVGGQNGTAYVKAVSGIWQLQNIGQIR